MKINLMRVVLTVLVIVIIFLAYMVGYTTHGEESPIPIQATSTTLKTNATSSLTYPAYEDKILDCVAQLESSNTPTLIYLDVNGKFSRGSYQFQTATLRDIYPNKTDAELIAIALDPVQSRAIARDLIFNKHEWYRWFNTFKKMEAGQCLQHPDILNNVL